MQNAETVLGVLRDRGSKGLPCNELYRQLFNPQLYLLAYGRIYSNNGAMTPGVTQETADGMSVEKIERIIDALRHERYRFAPVRRKLNDAAGTREQAVTERLAEQGFPDSWQPEAPLESIIESLRVDSEGDSLVGLYQMTVMHARRSAAIGSVQLDAIISVLEGIHIDDAHASVAPLARSAAEHLGLVGWLLEPDVPPRTQIARHVVHLTRTRKEFEGVRSSHSRRLGTERGAQFALQQEGLAHQAGLSLRGRAHERPVRADPADWVAICLGVGATVLIENPPEDARACASQILRCPELTEPPEHRRACGS